MKITIKLLIIAITLVILTIKPSFGTNNSAYKNDEILVKFKSSVSKSSKLKINQKINAKLTKRFKRIKVEQIKLPKDISVEEAIKFYENKKEVEYAEPNYKRTLQATPNDTSFNSLWGLHNTGQTGGTADADIDAPEAWNLSTGSNDVVVAVFDTGVDYTHPDLAPNMWTNTNENPSDGLDNDSNGYVNDLYGVNTAYSGYQSGNPMDIDEHGTHVAGTIGAKGNNAEGVTGVNWTVKIMAINIFKFEAGYSDPVTYDSDIIEGINYILEMKSRGANVVATNNSYGGSEFGLSMHTAINNLKNSNILFIAAAGNDNSNNDNTPFYPANYDVDNVISVAATNSSDNLAAFSNYGESTVDIAAPGSNIFSTIHPISGTQATINTGTSSYEAFGLEYAGFTNNSGITATLYNCSKGMSSDDFPLNVNGNIALIERGDITFATKVTNAQNAGAIGAIIYNNSPTSSYNSFTLSTPGNWIPVVSISQADGQSLVATGTPSVTLINKLSDSPYKYMSGTSMAAPHVTGLAALIADYHPEYNYLDIKNAILSSGDAKGSLSGKTFTGARINAYNALTLDVAPPTTSYSAQPSIPNGLNNWYKTIPTVSLSNSEPGTISYSWNSTSSFNTYTSSFTAPKGQNRLYYYSTDENGNSETVKNKPLKVDNTKPRTTAPYSRKVKRYSYARLYYRANDSYSPSVHITIRIKTLGNVTKKIIYPGWKPTNKITYKNYMAALPKGTYRFFIYAKDTAGNTQYNVASNKLVIY